MLPIRRFLFSWHVRIPLVHNYRLVTNLLNSLSLGTLPLTIIIINIPIISISRIDTNIPRRKRIFPLIVDPILGRTCRRCLILFLFFILMKDGGIDYWSWAYVHGKCIKFLLLLLWGCNYFNLGFNTVYSKFILVVCMYGVVMLGKGDFV